MFKRKKTGSNVPPQYNPPPTPSVEFAKPNPSYVPPASVKSSCPYITPCYWCGKLDKRCDCKIGCEKPDGLITILSECIAKIKYIAENEG